MWTTRPTPARVGCPHGCAWAQRSPNRLPRRRFPARYAHAVTRPLPRDPFAGTTKLFVDGTNLLHALTAGASAGTERRPPAAVIGRLRAAVPRETTITLVFDGPSERGVRGERIAGGLTVPYSGGPHT